jgi:dolichol-phosphate mannosyltransferase
MNSPSLETTLRVLEQERERRWRHRSEAVQLKLRWRALAVQHVFHLVPGETILELGAGSGILTEQLDTVFRDENPITSVVFCSDLIESARTRVPNAMFLHGVDLHRDLPSGRFDHVIGCGMLWHSQLPECLALIHRVLKPGGQILFFEPNFRFPARFFNEMWSHWRAVTSLQLSLDRVIQACSDHEFTDIDLTPCDIVSCRLGPRLMKQLEAKAVLLEHMPAVRFACASMSLTARKPGYRIKPAPNLAKRSALRDAVSVVVPAHNEAANIPRLIERLMSLYRDYIHEIIIVNDNSTDQTADVVQTIAKAEPQVRLINRTKPNGVGRALKDGYRAATGRFILSMDCDFVEILPEFRGLFDAVADGHAGAIGSRFSHDSTLTNYPFAKLVCNRLCHALIKLFLLDQVRDISNNLKLYRADILRDLAIESPHFSANLETGLKPLLAGHDIVEVPISWINRTFEMGDSRFDIRRAGVAYARTLFQCWRQSNTQHRGTVQLALRRILNRSVTSSQPTGT